MQKRLQFFTFGVFIGVILVLIFFKNRILASNYFSKKQLISEIQTKTIIIESSLTRKQMNNLGLNKMFVKDSIFRKGEINFNESKPKKKPCGLYKIYYPKSTKKYGVSFEKCTNKIKILNIYITKQLKN